MSPSDLAFFRRLGQKAAAAVVPPAMSRKPAPTFDDLRSSVGGWQDNATRQNANDVANIYASPKLMTHPEAINFARRLANGAIASHRIPENKRPIFTILPEAHEAVTLSDTAGNDPPMVAVGNRATDPSIIAHEMGHAVAHGKRSPAHAVNNWLQARAARRNIQGDGYDLVRTGGSLNPRTMLRLGEEFAAPWVKLLPEIEASVIGKNLAGSQASNVWVGLPSYVSGAKATNAESVAKLLNGMQAAYPRRPLPEFTRAPLSYAPMRDMSSGSTSFRPQSRQRG